MFGSPYKSKVWINKDFCEIKENGFLWVMNPQKNIKITIGCPNKKRYSFDPKSGRFHVEINLKFGYFPALKARFLSMSKQKKKFYYTKNRRQKIPGWLVIKGLFEAKLIELFVNKSYPLKKHGAVFQQLRIDLKGIKKAKFKDDGGIATILEQLLTLNGELMESKRNKTPEEAQKGMGNQCLNHAKKQREDPMRTGPLLPFFSDENMSFDAMGEQVLAWQKACQEFKNVKQQEEPDA